MTNKTSIGDIITASLRENLKPGLVLQALAVTVLLLYYFVPPVRSALEVLGHWKQEGGFVFSAFSTSFFGGVVPYLLMLFTGRIAPEKQKPLFWFYFIFWMWKGIEVDLLYRGQAMWYGNSSHWLVVALKVMTDQFIYCPIWAVPTMMIFYLWKDSGFSVAELKRKLAEVSFFQRWLRVLISNILVWVPAVCVVYMLPLSLQIPLFNLVLVFWTLILASVAEK